MLRRALILLAGGLVALPLLNEPAEAQSARCGFYAGMGYRCFGTAGGTGGRVFRQMDANTRRCGYFNPGCVGRSARPFSWVPVVGYARPVSPGHFGRPSIGPGYVRPNVGPGFVRPSVGPGFARPSIGYLRPSVGPGYRRPATS
jgi:hypothetical protein